jgi:hypothetical protein
MFPLRFWSFPSLIDHNTCQSGNEADYPKWIARGIAKRIAQLNIFNLQTTLWFCSKRVQRVEIRIGRLNTRTVMERAGGDQNIGSGNCYPLGACATRQIARRRPHIIINLQFGKCSFQISKYRTLTSGLRAVPKFEPDQRTPTRLAFREHTFDPSPNFFITLRPQEMNP